METVNVILENVAIGANRLAVAIGTDPKNVYFAAAAALVAMAFLTLFPWKGETVRRTGYGSRRRPRAIVPFRKI